MRGMNKRRVTLVAGALVVGACGKDGASAPARQYDGSVRYTIAVPSELEEIPERDDGGWKVVKYIPRGGALSDVIITWQPTWSFDEMLAWFNDTAVRQGEVDVREKVDLPDGRGHFIHYTRGTVEYAKSVVRCNATALQCMATLANDDPAELRRQVVAACKTLVCR